MISVFVVILIMILLLWVVLYYINLPRYEPKASNCAGRLKLIGLALKQYSMDYDGHFPPENGVKGFKLLTGNDYINDYKIFQCHKVSFENKLKRYQQLWGLTFLFGNEISSKSPLNLTEQLVHFDYRGGLSVNDSSDNAIAWDKPGNHKDFGNILFVDGHVKGYSGKDWQKNIK